MIQVKVKKLKAKRDDLSDALTVDAANMAAEGFARKVEEKVKGVHCDHHPDKVSTLLVVADRNKLIRIDKKGFCCQRFADQVKITVD